MRGGVRGGGSVPMITNPEMSDIMRRSTLISKNETGEGVGKIVQFVFSSFLKSEHFIAK